MKRKRVALLGIALALVLGLSGCGFLNTVKAKDHLNRAAQEYNRGNYDAALQLLEQALALDPDLAQLKPYYGATLYAKYNLSGEEEYVRKALQVYEEIYQTESQKSGPDETTLSNAVAYIAVIHDNLGDKAKKREWMLKRLELPGMTDAKKAEVYYALGTDYWNESFEITQKYVVNQPPEPTYRVPEEEKPKVRQLANQGLEYTNQALALQPEYGDALTYKNLLLRELAKIETDAAAKKNLIDQADEVRNKARELIRRRQQEAEQQQQPQGQTPQQ